MEKDLWFVVAVGCQVIGLGDVPGVPVCEGSDTLAGGFPWEPSASRLPLLLKTGPTQFFLSSIPSCPPQQDHFRFLSVQGGQGDGPGVCRMDGMRSSVGDHAWLGFLVVMDFYLAPTGLLALSPLIHMSWTLCLRLNRAPSSTHDDMSLRFSSLA